MDVEAVSSQLPQVADLARVGSTADGTRMSAELDLVLNLDAASNSSPDLSLFSYLSLRASSLANLFL